MFQVRVPIHENIKVTETAKRAANFDVTLRNLLPIKLNMLSMTWYGMNMRRKTFLEKVYFLLS